MSHYRDPLAGLKSQVATKRALLESRERDLSPVLRALLPAELRRRLADLRPRALVVTDAPANEGEGEREGAGGGEVGDGHMAVLADADAALDAALALHDEALASSRALRTADDEVPDPARPKMAPPWLFEEPHVLRIREGLRRSMAAIDGAATIARFGDHAYIARFHIVDAPYAFVVRTSAKPDEQYFPRHESFLRTSMPPTLERLDVRREHVHHAIGKALHLVREIELGDPSFDDLFWVTGAPATAGVLTHEVRRALVRVAPHGPVLQVSDGMATLSWTGPYEEAVGATLPQRLLDVLVSLRTAIERD